VRRNDLNTQEVAEYAAAASAMFEFDIQKGEAEFRKRLGELSYTATTIKELIIEALENYKGKVS